VSNFYSCIVRRDAAIPTGVGGPIPDECIEVVHASDYRRLHAALTRIAFEPFGPADASAISVVESMTACAREALENT
jgi:hypothetical protein